MSKYDYEELKNKALSENATTENINALGKLFEQYGDSFEMEEIRFSIDKEAARSFIGIELDEHYFEVAKNRIELKRI